MVAIDAPTGADSWIKLNHNQVGYYRVNYPENIWQRFAELLVGNVAAFSIGDRTGLLNDAFALADASHLRYDLALGLTKFLVHDTEYVPWAAVSSKMKTVRNLIYDYPSYDDILVSIVNRAGVAGFYCLNFAIFSALRSSACPTSLHQRWLGSQWR